MDRREPQPHGPLCASRVGGECTCGEFEAQVAASKKKITITMEGGIIQSITGIPEDVAVEIRDYDVESYDLEKLTKDEQGDDCYIATWISG